MGFLDKVGKVAKDVGKGVIDTGKSIKKGIDDNIERQRQKRILFSNFTISDFKRICSEYGIGEPSSYDEDFLTGEREKITLKRDDWLGFVEQKLTIEQVEEFCRRHRIRIPESYQGKRLLESQQPAAESKIEKPSVIREQRYEEPLIPQTHVFERPLQQDLIKKCTGGCQEILDFIKEFRPEPFLDEKDLQNQLKVRLESQYPGRVAREVGTQLGGKIDFVIDGKYGIEVKPIWDKKTLQDLIGQIILYKKAFNEVGIILCDINKLPHAIVHEFLNEYKNQGVLTVMIPGSIRSRRGRSKGVTVTWK